MKKLLIAALAATLFTLTFTVSADQFVPSSDMPRSEVPAKYKWQTNHMFATQEAWEAEYAGVEEGIDTLAGKCKGKLSTSRDVLESCYQDYYDLLTRMLKVSIFSEINFYTEMSNMELAQNMQKGEILSTKFSTAFSFIIPEVKALGKDKALDWISSGELADYMYSFEELFRLQEHILSDKEEKIKAQMGKVFAVPNNMYHSIEMDLLWDEFVTDSVLVDGKYVAEKDKISIGKWGKYRILPNRKLREEAAKAFLNSLGNYGHIFSSNLTMSLDIDHFQAQTSKYDSVVEMKLDGSNIPVEVHRNLVDTVDANLSQTLHRYVTFKKKVLKLNDFRFWDNYASMMPSYDTKINYEDSVNLIVAALKPYLGEKYVSNFKMATDPVNGWVDVFPNKDKYSGAFSYGVYGVHPFLLLNHQDSYRDMFTIAHEGGHSMHSYYTGKNQKFPFYYVDPFLAEIASTTNEVLVYEHLINKAKKEKNREMLLYLYDSLLDNIRQTLMRQTQFAEFEEIIHQQVADGKPTTLEFFNETYADLIQKYYGPDFKMTELENGQYLDGNEWMFVSHFFRSFYVYSYATSISVGISIAKGLKDGSITADQYIKGFLSKGSSEPPCDAIKAAGVDITTPVPVKYAMDYFAELMDKFEKLYFENKF